MVSRNDEVYIQQLGCWHYTVGQVCSMPISAYYNNDDIIMIPNE